MEKNHRVLAFMIIYNPDRTLLIDNVDRFINYVDKLIIWQNTMLDFQIRKIFEKYSNIEYLGEGKNYGISKPLNKGLEYAIENEYDFMLTMDQDSRFEGFYSYISTSVDFNKNGFCVIGPYQKVLDDIDYSADAFHNYKWVITSGAIFPVKLLMTVGGFQERFFVDSVDIEICLKAKAAGYGVYINTNGELLQRYGQPKFKLIFGKKVYYTLYTPDRYVNIFKNLTLLLRRYGNLELFREILIFSKIALKSALLDSKQRWGIISAIINGVFTGLKEQKL